MTPFVPLTQFDDVAPIISKISLFGGVSEAQLTELLKRLDYASFRKGEYVFQKGDEPTRMYIVKTGRVELKISDAEAVVDKRELTVGTCFGEVSLMCMHKHTTTALVLEDCEIVGLSRRALIQLQQQDISLFALLMMNVARELARRLMTTDDLYLLYMHKLRQGQ